MVVEINKGRNLPRDDFLGRPRELVDARVVEEGQLVVIRADRVLRLASDDAQLELTPEQAFGPHRRENVQLLARGGSLRIGEALKEYGYGYFVPMQ